jgi:glycosyltransferase involved in cell wall biosynthesis
LAQKLADKADITVVAFAKNGVSFEGVRLRVIDKNHPLPIRLWKFFQTVYTEAQSADIIYVQNAMAAGLPSVLAGKLRRKPVVLKFVGDEAWERATQHKKTVKHLEEFLEHPDGGLKISLMRYVQGWVLRQCAVVTTPSKYLGEAITKAYRLDPKKVVTNYNAAESTTEAPFSGVKKPHQIVATARLVEWKGIDGIIEAVAILRPTYPDITFILHGDGPTRASLESLAAERNVADCITFTGNVSRSETWYTRKCSAVYILNSIYEGLPHTALTSFAAGIPIIATDIDGTNEAVYHEQTGLLVPPQNPQALASAIARLFEDIPLQERLVAGGNVLLHEKFSWEAHLETLGSIFQSVLLKPRHEP